MKKQLIAVAVAAAVAAPAMAQNVTVSGGMDVGFAAIDNGTDTNNTVVSGVLLTPSIKFAGTEDLGGGLKAGFTLTQEFNVANGVYTDSTNTASAAGQSKFQEVSVGLSGGFGAVKLGKFNMDSRDAGGVYRFAGEFARLSAAFRDLGSKTESTIQYTTPSINGVTVSVASANYGTDTRATATPEQLGIAVKYAKGPLTLAYAQTESDVGAAKNNTESMFGGSYDAGIAKVGVLFANEEATDGTKTSGRVINVAMPMGNGMTLHGSIHSYDKDATTNDNARVYGVALTKDMSKRTTVYAGYISNKSEATAFTMGTSGQSANQTTSGMAVGVVHKF